jgi:metal-responsive CopG/Arc/MetJ family transcriptional regulator
METALAKTELIRRSISLPHEIAERVDEIAATRHVSANRAMIDLLRDAIAAYDQRKKAFLELADRFQKSTDASETQKLRDELARMTFGG